MNRLSRRQALRGAATLAGAEMLLQSSAQTASASVSGGGANVLPPQLYTMRDGRSGQFTTFDNATKQKEYNLKPGETKVLAEHLTPGIITRMWFTLSGWFWENWDGDDESRWPDATILKKVILRIYWDGNPFPSVEAPIGDFFGMGQCEYRPYLSDFIGLSSGGFYCYFPMPFQKVRIEVQNLHDRLVPAMFLNANYQALDALPPGAGRFHCLYNAGTNPGSSPSRFCRPRGAGISSAAPCRSRAASPITWAFWKRRNISISTARTARRQLLPARGLRITSTAAGISAKANSPGRSMACR